MMTQVVVRPSAQAEIDDLAEWIARDNPDAAQRFLHAIAQTAAYLIASPSIGRRWELQDLPDAEIRFWHVAGFRDYLIFYRMIESGIEILHLVHGARDLPSLLESDPEI